ncbi:hypothetical protein CFP65_6100 [Kitasatospora sp. MMS16-BH015]|uniref:hypothetical protein n=1 Tax=Kitasatospora sp. MMS16-BH015 TaxID=2018025 RepID=UPI000CA30F53|nr:hypothetical protein [Kitasatospora sp. MMS16-BH015]AUG80769.1 hypothetical protein CFP65_6100 [Kitasatospora sp. MMS16-BH015]
MADSYRLDRLLCVGAAQVPLRVREGDQGWDELVREIAGLAADRYVLLTDGVVPEQLAARLPAGQRLRVPGVVSLQTVQRLAERVAAEGVGRRTVLIAVGGEGLCGTAGVLAGLLLRGLRLVLVPTTLAALGGSALSLRQRLPCGPDLGAAIGVWHAPALVWGQLDLLAAAPPDRLRADLVTVARHVLAVCPSQLDRIAPVLGPTIGAVLGSALGPTADPALGPTLGPTVGPAELTASVAICADARAAVAEHDPQEVGPARALEYGRVLGQAIVSVAGEGSAWSRTDGRGRLPAQADGPGLSSGAHGAPGGSPGRAGDPGLSSGALGGIGRPSGRAGGHGLLPGYADGLGLLLAARIAGVLGLLDPAGERAHRDLLRRIGAPVALPPGIDLAALLEAVGRAMAATGEPGLLLLAGLGRPHVAEGSLLTRIGPDTLRSALDSLHTTPTSERRSTTLAPASASATGGAAPASAPGPASAPVPAPAPSPVVPAARAVSEA